MPRPPQRPEPAGEGPVLPAPGEGPAVEGVLKALHARLVPVVHRGGAGEGIEHQGGQLQPGQPQRPLLRRQAAGRPPIPAVVPALAPHPQQGEDAHGVVGAQGVHGGVEGRRGIVLPQGLHLLLETAGVPAQEPVQHRAAEGVVHQPVQIAPQQVLPADRVSNLVGAVLPHLPDDHRLRLGLPDGGAEGVDKVVGQLVGHVQPPAVRPGAQPPADDAVGGADDVVHVARLALVDGGEGVDAPPGVVFVRPVGEVIPAVIGGGLGLAGPHGGVGAVPVEVFAHIALVVEDSVQQHPHAPGVGGGAQGAKGLLRAQHGVDLLVVPGAVAVVLRPLKDGTEVEGVHPQLLQVVQLF